MNDRPRTPYEHIDGMIPASTLLPPSKKQLILAIKREILTTLKPGEEEITLVLELTRKVITTIESALKEHGIAYSFIEPQGSTGIKQTQLAGSSDVDLFIGLDLSCLDRYREGGKVQKSKIKEEFKRYIHEIIEPALQDRLDVTDAVFSYAEHPYLTVVVDSIEFDIVFCFDIDKEYIEAHGTITSMDRTPLHSKFVKDSLNDAQKDDVRLLKAFIKAAHVYGDKSAPGRMGFVGYALEILVHFFGDMETLMVNFEALENEPIDVFHRPKRTLLSNPRFSQDVLVIIDPTDARRNVGSSTDGRAYRHAVTCMKEFLESPAKEAFNEHPIPAPQNDDGHFFAVTFENTRAVHYTVVRDKLYKLATTIQNRLQKEPTHEKQFGTITFELVTSPDEGEAALAFNVERPAIPRSFERTGPHASSNKRNINKFLAKHPDAFLGEDKRYRYIKEREHSKFDDALRAILQKELDIEGVSARKGEDGEIIVSATPRDEIARQAIHVLKAMVLANV